ncbi:glycosyltransferase family 2 protein [Bergeyella porcorum]|uniref:glycosyltransferase family 2 protein n=1 Tax=Bergeyella porcorum TaxID=1735111 RepID=UPI0035E5BE73
MKFLIIIPAHNEEDYLLHTLKSLEAQSYQNFKVMIVNDGSTDRTQKIAHTFSYRNPQFIVLNLETSQHAPGAKVVRTFNKGLELVDLDQFDIICKFDADVIFPPNYLEKVQQVYRDNPKAGMVSGLVYIEVNGEWVFENLSSKQHIRGPIKSYRKECFQAMGGLRPVLGWDNIDVMLCKMHGYETVALQDLRVKHLRPTAYKYKAQKAEKLGEYFYNIGLDTPLATIASLKSSLKNRSFTEFFTTMKTFFRFQKQNKERVLTEEEIQFIRQTRWKTMKGKLFF